MRALLRDALIVCGSLLGMWIGHRLVWTVLPRWLWSSGTRASERKRRSIIPVAWGLLWCLVVAVAMNLVPSPRDTYVLGIMAVVGLGGMVARRFGWSGPGPQHSDATEQLDCMLAATIGIVTGAVLGASVQW
jgi:hypothetical protein